jgi:hypothetical protein
MAPGADVSQQQKIVAARRAASDAREQNICAESRRFFPIAQISLVCACERVYQDCFVVKLARA